jgi:hypothetical protein
MMFAAGCDAVRFAPDESQKQNAWLHNRTAAMAAGQARQEQTSQTLQSLSELSAEQSGAFVAYYGLPREIPKAETVNDVLVPANKLLAQTATQQGFLRPDGWTVADNLLEVGIGIIGLLGGVYGARAASFLKDARDKSQALKEIIAGNELFKQQHADAVVAFKEAQKEQSVQTRQIVAAMK